VNNFNWQINYVKAIEKLLNCYQRLGTSSPVCKISQPFVTYLIYTSQHSGITHKKQLLVQVATRSSAIAGRPCDAKACQG